MAREDHTRAKLAQKVADVLAYKGSALFIEVVALLDAIDECYREEMLTVTPESLRYKQGAAAQARVLRNLLVDANTMDLPKV